VDTVAVECLGCGHQRVLVRGPLRELWNEACPRCGYLGWAESQQLTEAERRVLRSRPVARRRLRVV
jgi:hypothetical protein